MHPADTPAVREPILEPRRGSRGGWHPQPFQCPPHRRGPRLDAEGEQLILGSPVASARVLPCHRLGQHGGLRGGVSDLRECPAVGATWWGLFWCPRGRRG